MDTALLDKKFAQIGARLKVMGPPPRRFRDQQGIRLDIGIDRRGEFFAIRAADADNVEVLHMQPRDRHLLLMVRENGEKSKFLCGHDERHWFVAGIPESAPVGMVAQAKDALKPLEVRAAESQKRVSGKARNRRKNTAFIRQGEWFFLPTDDLAVDESWVLSNEPLRRGGGKPHWAEFCYRTGGESVYVCSRHPNGVTAQRYRNILSGNRNAKNWGWTSMVRNAGVYVRGRIRHPDHATITLAGWHRVAMNTENESRAMRHVAFLD
ncbi:hypothetical protein Mal52_09810 [Symmachiella dynata]|uniref:Uncharacterized protein n=1 Tax=Symmachiella dynata TaxID=2527995 RepID=A0A517ZJ63_9PLAN|nr:hypothetical protein [Symmachiella dynata]QDU42518.1 hypothetical protein Mal52_09810 [Symmachiella dynata]